MWNGEVEMKMAIIVFGVVIVLVAAVRLVTYDPPLQQELMNSSDMTVLLLCQTKKVYKDLGVVEGKRYLTAVLIKVDPAANNSQHGQTSLPRLRALAHIAPWLSLPPALRGCELPPYALWPLSC